MRATRPQIKTELSARIAQQIAEYDGKTQQVQAGIYAMDEPSTPRERNKIQWQLRRDNAQKAQVNS